MKRKKSVKRNRNSASKKKKTTIKEKQKNNLKNIKKEEDINININIELDNVKSSKKKTSQKKSIDVKNQNVNLKRNPICTHNEESQIKIIKTEKSNEKTDDKQLKKDNFSSNIKKDEYHQVKEEKNIGSSVKNSFHTKLEINNKPLGANFVEDTSRISSNSKDNVIATKPCETVSIINKNDTKVGSSKPDKYPLNGANKKSHIISGVKTTENQTYSSKDDRKNFGKNPNFNDETQKNERNNKLSNENFLTKSENTSTIKQNKIISNSDKKEKPETSNCEIEKCKSVLTEKQALKEEIKLKKTDTKESEQKVESCSSEIGKVTLSNSDTNGNITTLKEVGKSEIYKDREARPKCKCFKKPGCKSENTYIFAEDCPVCSKKSNSINESNNDKKGLNDTNLFGTPKTRKSKD